MPNQLRDLDELVLSCFNKKARQYIDEAVRCYKAGAYRSAIVATWIAVFFDIVEKLRDLALSEDAGAKKRIAEFDATTNQSDPSPALLFERKLLDVAHSEFEFFSTLELTDLKRIQEDRHRCAHPTVAADGSMFMPTPDIARTHIVNAVDLLLKHPAVQGKAALDRVCKDLTAEYFPTQREKVKAAIKAGPLRRARFSLIRNFIVVSLKNATAATDYHVQSRFQYALEAMREMYPEDSTDVLKAEVNRIVKGLDDDGIGSALILLHENSDFWDMLSDEQKGRIEEYVKRLPTGSFEEIEIALALPPLYKVASERVKRMTLEDVRSTVFFGLPKEVRLQIVSMYEESTSFQQANNIAEVILNYSADFKESEASRLIAAGRNNKEVKGSFDYEKIVGRFQERFPSLVESKEAE